MSPKPPPSETPRRRYPRAAVKVKTRVYIDGAKGRLFDATLSSSDIGVGGIFFESTFFLKLGQQVNVELKLPPHERLVKARGKIVRIEQLEAGDRKRSGFAVKFEEYLDASDVVLANYFLAPVLRKFVSNYARKHGLSTDREDVESIVDVLAAWELSKAESPDGSDLWRNEN